MNWGGGLSVLEVRYLGVWKQASRHPQITQKLKKGKEASKVLDFGSGAWSEGWYRLVVVVVGESAWHRAIR